MNTPPGWLDGLSVRARQCVIVAGLKSSAVGPIEIGSAPFDPRWFMIPPTGTAQSAGLVSAVFVVFACGGSPTQQTKLDLVNKATGVTIASITTDLNVTSPKEYSSSVLTIPSTNLPASRFGLGVVLTPVGGASTDIAQCTYAALEIAQ